MKKLFILLAVAIGFVACSEEDTTNFAEIPVEEVLTMKGGIDWLIKQKDAVNWAEFNEDMQYYAYKIDKSSRLKDIGESKWTSISDWVGGLPLSHFLFLDDHTLRTCFHDSTGNFVSKFLYQDVPYVLDEANSVLSYSVNDLSFLYYQEGVLIVEVLIQNSVFQFVYTTNQTRQEMMDRYATEASPENMLEGYRPKN